MGVASSPASQARARARPGATVRLLRVSNRVPRDDAPGSIREEDVSPPATRVVVPDVLAMHLQHPNPALLKRPGSRGGGGGGGLGTLHPMSVSGRRGRFVPVALVVVFMFFVAVYRCAERPRLHNDRFRHPPSAPPARLTRLRRPLTEPRLDPARSRSFPRRESTMLAERANESGSLSHFRATPRGVPSETSSSLASSRSTSGPDSSSSSSPSRRWQLDALGAAHRDVAGETAKLAAEVKRLSQSVQASARTVRDDPYPEYVPVTSPTPTQPNERPNENATETESYRASFARPRPRRPAIRIATSVAVVRFLDRRATLR